MSLPLFLAAASAPLAGEVLVYNRSDTDGDWAEKIVIYDRAPGEVWVHKARTKCTSAAFVKGELDPATGQALRLVGGRLTRELDQEPFAWLARDEDSVLRVRLGSEAAPAALQTGADKRWVLFDFDFSDVIAHPPAEIANREDFAFDFPLLLVGEEAPVFENLGRLTLSFGGEGAAAGTPFTYYVASGEPLADKIGEFWFGVDGRLIDAVMPIPNHSEHEDFRLRLVSRDQGEPAWKAELAKHWEGCLAGV